MGKYDRMISQAFAHAILSTAIVTSSSQATEPGLAHKLPTTQIAVSNVASIEKQWNFAIENYRMRHHNSFQTLNLAVNCKSDQADLSPKLLAIYGEISEFLRTYPNEDDYWEIINRELTKTILQHYSELSSVAITLEVLPTERLPYTRASIVTQNRDGERTEGWRFTSRVPIQVKGVDLEYEVEYLYRNGITNTEYPDFVPINDRIAQLLMAGMIKGEPWEHTNQDIAESMLQKYPVLYAFTSHIENTPKEPPALEARKANW